MLRFSWSLFADHPHSPMPCLYQSRAQFCKQIADPPNRSTAFTAERCLAYEQPQNNFYTWTVRYCYMSVLAQYASLSGLESSPTLQLTWYLLPCPLIVTYVPLSPLYCHSHPVAIPVAPKSSKSSNHITAAVNTLICDTHMTKIEVKVTSISVRIALQGLLQTHTECLVMVITSISGIHIVEPWKLEGIHQLMFATHGVIGVVPSKPFHILISNFFTKEMNLPNRMMVMYVTGSPKSVKTVFSNLHHQPSRRIS